jgi:hypothetical protein
MVPGGQYEATSPPEGFHAVALTADGPAVTDADFGFRLPPTDVRVQVFQDADADGLLDGDEPGAEGVSVHLIDPVNGLLDDGDDVTVAQSVTGPHGVVTFAGISEGTYAVKVERPGTVPFSPRDMGDEALDSDVDPSTGLTELFYSPRDGASEITVGLDARRRVFGTDGNDALYVRLDVTGLNVEIFLGDSPVGTPAYVLPRSGFLSLLLAMGGGDDAVILDLVNGNPVPAGGIVFDGGADSGGGDRLGVVGHGAAATFKPTSFSSAEITLDLRRVVATDVEGYELRDHASLSYITPLAEDVIAAAGGRITGVSGGVALPPVDFAEVGELSFDLAAGEGSAADDVLTIGPATLDADSVSLRTGGGADTARILGGAVRLTVTASSSLSLMSSGDAVVTLANAPDLAALVLDGSSRISFPIGSTRAPRLNSVSIATGARLDTADTNLIVRTTAGSRHGVADALGQRVRSAFSHGTWSGPGLYSSVAAGDARGITGLAVVVNDEGTDPGSGEVLLRRFGNRPVDGSSVIVKHTYHGDADLSGHITIDDFFRIDLGYSRRIRYSDASPPTYRDGDFDYDGWISASDYMLIDRSFLGQTVVYNAGQSGRATAPSGGDDDGQWTDFHPSADSRVVYVSSSDGDDANSGLSPDAPVRTLGKAKGLMRGNKPDWMLLKRGDVWSDEQLAEWTVGGRSAEEPMLIGAYGDAPERPVIEWNGVGAALSMRLNRQINHLAVVGIHFSGGPNVAGAGIHRLSPGESFLIEDCVFEGFGTGLVVHGFYEMIEGVTIRRSVIADNAPRSGRGHGQGIFIDLVDGLLIEENLIDRNGWRAANRSDATIFNHNIYLTADNENVVVRRNIIARASSHGLQARAGGIVEDNVFVGNPIGMSYGLVNGSRVYEGGVSGRVTGNVVLDAGDIRDTALRGWAMEIANIRAGSDTTISNNIFAHDKSRGSFAAIQFSIGQGNTNGGEAAGIRDLLFEENVVYNWESAVWFAGGLTPEGAGIEGYSGLVIRDNDFQGAHLGKPVVMHTPQYSAAAEAWSSNTYDGVTDPSRWFRLGSSWEHTAYNQWRSTVEPDGEAKKVVYADPERSVDDYAAGIGLGASLEALLDAARLQGRESWQENLTAAPMLEFIRAGFAAA